MLLKNGGFFIFYYCLFLRTEGNHVYRTHHHHHHHQSPNREGRWGTTDDFATSFLHLLQVLDTCDCVKFLSIYFYLCVDAIGVVCHQLGLLGTDLHVVG